MTSAAAHIVFARKYRHRAGLIRYQCNQNQNDEQEGDEASRRFFGQVPGRLHDCILAVGSISFKIARSMIHRQEKSILTGVKFAGDNGIDIIRVELKTGHRSLRIGPISRFYGSAKPTRAQ